MEDTAGLMHRFAVTTSGNSITQILLDGSPTGQTGTMAHRSGNIFGFTLNDGTVGGFFLDTAQTHAAFLDNEFNIGVVQLNASTTTLPTWVYTDLNGSWSGITITIPSISFATFNTTSSSASCSLPSTCTSGVTTSTFLQVNFNALSGPSRGRWVGSFTRSSGSPASGSTSAFLSVDRTFGATWACGNVNLFPSTCEFTAWSKL
jgi:hypothetical protein